MHFDIKLQKCRDDLTVQLSWVLESNIVIEMVNMRCVSSDPGDCQSSKCIEWIQTDMCIRLWTFANVPLKIDISKLHISFVCSAVNSEQQQMRDPKNLVEVINSNVSCVHNMQLSHCIVFRKLLGWMQSQKCKEPRLVTLVCYAYANNSNFSGWYFSGCVPMCVLANCPSLSFPVSIFVSILLACGCFGRWKKFLQFCTLVCCGFS